MPENIRPNGVVHLRQSVNQKEIPFVNECHHFRRQVHPVVMNGMTSWGTRRGQRNKQSEGWRNAMEILFLGLDTGADA